MIGLQVFLMGITLLSGLVQAGLIGPSRTAIEQEFGLSHAAFGAGLAAIQIVVPFTCMLLTGWVRRLNSLKVMAAGLAIQLAGFALLIGTSSLGMLVLAWTLIIFGISQNALGNNVMMDAWPKNPARGLVIFHGTNALGKFIGPLIAAGMLLLAARSPVVASLGWRGSFGAAAVLFVAFLAFTAVLLARGTAGRVHPPVPAAHPTLSCLRDRRYWLVVAGFGMIAGGEAAFATLAPAYFEKVEHLSRERAALLLSVHLSGLVIGRFAAAWFSGRVHNNVILAVCLASGAAVFPAVFSHAPAIRWPALVVTGLMFSSTWPTFYAQVAAPLSRHREMLAYGSGFGSFAGVALCVLCSSALADGSLLAGVLFGPIVLWAFAAVYFTSRLARKNCPAI